MEGLAARAKSCPAEKKGQILLFIRDGEERGEGGRESGHFGQKGGGGGDSSGEDQSGLLFLLLLRSK